MSHHQYNISPDKRGKRVGLLLTVIFHLLIVIVLLIVSLREVIRQEVTFISDQDLARRVAEEELTRKEVLREIALSQIEEALSSLPAKDYKAIPVQSSQKDDRNTNAEELYKEAEELQERIKEAGELDDEYSPEDTYSAAIHRKREEVPSYKGPSVLNWNLDGRSAFLLPIPVYKCHGGGDITVQILVGRNGYVKSAKVLEGSSVPDNCIREAALAAAQRSRFSVSDIAPDPQYGQITYRFIAQ